MKKVAKIILKITSAIIGIVIILFIGNLFLEIDYKLRSDVARMTFWRLMHYNKKCGKYPTTVEGLDALQRESSCYIPPKAGRKLKTKNGYGVELIYESDGKKFTLTSKSLLDDTVLTEEIIAPRHDEK